MRDHNDGHYANHHYDDRLDHPHSPDHHDLHLDHDSGANHHDHDLLLHDLHHDHLARPHGRNQNYPAAAVRPRPWSGLAT